MNKLLKYSTSLIIAGIFLFSNTSQIFAACGPRYAPTCYQAVSCQKGNIYYCCDTADDCNGPSGIGGTLKPIPKPNVDQNTDTNNSNSNTKTPDFSINYDALNDQIGLKSGNSTLTGIFSNLLPYILTFAGLILFVMLVSGGFTMLAGAADKESQEKGKKQITSAFIGFIIIFLAYWLAQILQVIFKINIVS